MVTVTVGAWMGRWAPHLYFDFAAEEPVIASRTASTITLTNDDVNDAPVKIGELVVAGQVDTLIRGVHINVSTPLTYGRSGLSGKKGPEYIHDRRSRDRSWVGEIIMDATDKVTFDGWQDESYGVNPFLVWPLNDITREPIFARFIDPTYQPTLNIPRISSSMFAIRELSCGEAY